MLPRDRMKVSLSLAFLCLLPGLARAQTGMAYSLDDVMELVKGGLSSSSILGRVKGACISFRITQSVSDRLRSEGANDALIDGLRNTCYKSDSKSGGDTRDRPPTRVVPRPIVRPTPRRDTTPSRVIPPYTPPVITPSRTTPNQGTIDWNFRTSQPLSSGKFGNCQYDYGPNGYTLTVVEYGSPCYDGSMQEWEPNIRVTAQATPISGAPGFTYGLRFGISDDTTVGYYAFELSSYGDFELSRYRNNKWEVVFPWQTGGNINTSSANTVTADIQGSTVNFIINGVNKYTYHAPAPIRGRVGFGIIGFATTGPFPVVAFSSFNVSGEKSVTSNVTPTPTPTPTPSNGAIDYDLRSSRPLTPGRYGKCVYDYTSSGYLVTVAEAGTACIDGPMAEQPANVRVSATALPVAGGTGYTYGLRFGYTSDSTVGYYAFELSEGGSFQLSRYRMHQWEPLIRWQQVAAVHPASSGTENTLTADIRGTSITLYVNGTQVGTYVAPYPPIGPAGFGIIGYDQSLALPSVVFRRFTVTPLSSTNVTIPTNTTTTTPTSTVKAVSWDFRSSQPLSTGVYGTCRYEYANGGYTITVDSAGSMCIDGPAGDQPASVRVSATARGLRGGTGYTYGLRLAYNTDASIGYYTFEVSRGGSFQFSRKLNGVWNALIPWQQVSAVNAATTGLPNEITAEIRGTSIVLYVNGTQVGSYQAPSPPVGPMGFGVIGYDGTLELPSVVFTRFSVSPLY